jgi:DNA-binding PadR family transcriptional regulator
MFPLSLQEYLYLALPNADSSKSNYIGTELSMTSLFAYSTKSGRTRSLLALYVLHSLDQGDKSGYDILSEISTLTDGSWVPSKGTLYPLLHQLATEGLIASFTETRGARARTVFTLAHPGKETLRRIRVHGGEHDKKMAQYRQIITAIFGEHIRPETGMIFEIKALVDEVPKEKEPEAMKILRRCRDDLKKVI